jgi:hypothetical protein
LKIIFSRKGFDSESGRVASPIFHDDSFISLPIPSRLKRETRYNRQRISGGTLGPIVTDLTRGRHRGSDTAHLDPDLRANTLSDRSVGWRPIFGQVKQAQGHLDYENVGPGDLFLFFGWFRRVESLGGAYRFVPRAPDIHAIFGWLQIDQVIPGGPSARADAPAWAQYHSHFYNDAPQNTVYLARETLTLPGLRAVLPGGGVFPQFHQSLCLTAPGETRGIWRLPKCFAPANGQSVMTYHDAERWTPDGKHCRLRTVGRGQEFVVSTTGRSGITKWVARLFDAV